MNKTHIARSLTLFFLALTASIFCFSQEIHASKNQNDINNRPIIVSNYTGLNDIESQLSDKLNAELKLEISKRNLAIFAFAATFPGQRICYAIVGLTETQSNGRNARFPTSIIEKFAKKSDKEWNPEACKYEVFNQAIEGLTSTPLEKLMNKIEETSSAGGTRSQENTNDGHIDLQMYGSPINTGYVSFRETIQKYSVAKALDYRNTEIVMFAPSTQLRSGETVCTAFAGLSGRAATDRNNRWPTSIEGFIHVQNGGNINKCRGRVAHQALNAVLSRPWTTESLLNSFSVTQDAGMPPPDISKIKLAKAELDKPISAQTPPDRRAMKEYYKFLSRGKIGVNMSCEGDWDLRDEVDIASIKCSSPDFKNSSVRSVNIRDLLFNGWEIMTLNSVPKNFSGWKSLFVSMKKVKQTELFSDSYYGPIVIND